MQGIEWYLLFGLFVVLGILAIRTVISYLGYSILQLQDVIPFKKVVLVLVVTVVIQGFIGRLFWGWDTLAPFSTIPLPVLLSTANTTSPTWSIFVYSTAFYDLFNLIEKGYIIYLPHHLFLFNLLVNIIPACYLFWATRSYLGLTGHKRHIFWLIMSASTHYILHIVSP
jgi:hypothetical protein